MRHIHDVDCLVEGDACAQEGCRAFLVLCGPGEGVSTGDALRVLAWTRPFAELLDVEVTYTETGFMVVARPRKDQWKEDKALVERLCGIVAFVESIAKWVAREPLTPAQRARAEQIDGR